MKQQRIMLELPELTDESAASLQNFIYELMYVIDEKYHKQIYRHYLHKLDVLMVDPQNN